MREYTPAPLADTGDYILLVDDNEDDADLTTHALKALGFAEKIVTARDGAEALAMVFHVGVFEERRPPLPRLVLLDIGLPKMSGLHVLEALRSDRRTESLPVVMLTSSAHGRDIIESFVRGANGFVQKPMDSAAAAVLAGLEHRRLHLKVPM